jgi:aspartate/methionine/tyrosine aminotransferase
MMYQINKGPYYMTDTPDWTRELPPLTGLMEDPGVGVLSDAQLLAGYLDSGNPLPPLAMSIGDPYLLGATLPQGLAEFEQKAPRYLGGYIRTPAGLPEARRLVREVTVQNQQLARFKDAVGTDFDLHLTSATGTRGIMRDFGHYLLDKHSREDTRTPVLLCATPTWDYAGALASLGYEMAYWPLRPENAWLPDMADADAAIAAIDADPTRRLALVVVNAQHSPTGRSWPKATLQHLFTAASTRGAGILLDDPYYFVAADKARPVSALAVLLEHLSGKRVPKGAHTAWCRVQSFGKAFVCNNWGIGSVIAHPETLSKIAAYTMEWAFPREGLRQWAMAHWLASKECDQYLAAQRAILGRKRAIWAKTLRTLGWPADVVTVGEVTPYFLVAIPPAYLAMPNGVSRWRQVLLDKTGLLFSYASITADDTDIELPYLRAYLGGSEAVVVGAAQRLVTANIRYDAPE